MLFDVWYYNLLRIIPESITLVALGTALVKEKFTFRKMALAGLIIGVIGSAVQHMPIEFGVQIPIGIITFILVLYLLLGLNVLRSAAASLLSFVILIMIEALSFYILSRMTGIPSDILLDGPDLSKFKYSLVPLLILILISLFFQFRLRKKSKE